MARRRYKRRERQYRISLFFSAASLAGAFGGILAYVCYASTKEMKGLLISTLGHRENAWRGLGERLAMDLYSRKLEDQVTTTISYSIRSSMAS